MVIIYVISVPVVLYLLLTNKLHYIKETQPELLADKIITELEQHKMNSFEGKYGLLYSGYQKKYYYWEVIVLARKVYICFLGALFGSNFHAQGLFAVVGLFFFGLVHAYVRPFASEQMNQLEALSIITSTLTYFFAQFTFVELGTGSRTAAGVFTFMVNISFCVYACHSFYSMFGGTIGFKCGSKPFDICSSISTLRPRERSSSCIHMDDIKSMHSKKISGAYEGMDFATYINENPSGPRIAAWKAFLKSEYSDENIDFYLCVRQFRLDAGHDPDAAPLALWEKAAAPPPLADALKYIVRDIVNTYIREGSDRQVNLPQRIQDAAVKAIDEDTCTTIVLDDAFHEIIRLMGRDSFPRFQDSEHWEKLLEFR